MSAFALVFAKYPEPGTVKTRLSPPLSPQEASDVHRAALEATCELVGAVDGLRTILVGTPDHLCERLGDELNTPVDERWTQGAGALGARLTRASERAFREGASRVLLFGADSPTLPPKVIEDALTALEACDAVIGSCDDGGYYLLGLSTPQEALFQGIDWGSERVVVQTRERAQQAGLALTELMSWYDIDRIDDLERAADDLGAAPVKPMQRKLQQTIDRVLDRVEGHG